MRLTKSIGPAILLGMSAFAVAATPASAASCRDAHGRFIKCGSSTAATSGKVSKAKIAKATPAKSTTLASTVIPKSRAAAIAAKPSALKTAKAASTAMPVKH